MTIIQLYGGGAILERTAVLLIMTKLTKSLIFNSHNGDRKQTGDRPWQCPWTGGWPIDWGLATAAAHRLGVGHGSCPGH